MQNTVEKMYFQDFMPENVCYGCGINNDEGLKIKSFWDGDNAILEWESQEKYHGWANLMNGGIMATLIDCHCMGTAMAHAYKVENRKLDSLPEYRYATGTMTIKYLKPTPNTRVKLVAQVVEVKGRKTSLRCDFFSADGTKTAEADVVAIRVYDSSTTAEDSVFKS